MTLATNAMGKRRTALSNHDEVACSMPQVPAHSHLRAAAIRDTPWTASASPVNAVEMPIRTIGLAVAIVGLALVGQFLVGGHVRALVQLTALIGVAATAIAFCFVRYDFEDARALFRGMRDRSLLTSDERTRAVDVLGSLRTYAFMHGIGMNALAIVTCVLPHLDDPSKLGAGVATGVVSLVYASAVAAFATVLSHALEQGMPVPRSETARRPRPARRPARMFLLIVGIGALVLALALEGRDMIVVQPRIHPGQAFFGVLAPAFLAIFIAYPARAVLLAISPYRVPRNDEAVHTSRRVFDLFADFVLMTGLFAFIVNVIHVYENFADPSKQGVGLRGALGAFALGLGTSMLARQFGSKRRGSAITYYAMAGVMVTLGVFALIIYVIT